MRREAVEPLLLLLRSLFFLGLSAALYQDWLPGPLQAPVLLYSAPLLLLLLLPNRPPLTSLCASGADVLLLTFLQNHRSEFPLPPPAMTLGLDLLFFLTLTQLPLRFGLLGLSFSFAAALLVLLTELRLGSLTPSSPQIFFFFLLFLSFTLVYTLPLFQDLKRLKRHLAEKEKEIQDLENRAARLQQNLQEEQVRDPLTGCFNEKYFKMKLSEEIPKAERHHYVFSICAIGLDRFRDFNEKTNSKKGDEALRAISMLLSAYTRTSDLLCRIPSRDVFLTFFPFTEKEQAKIPLSRFAEAVRQYRFDERDPRVRLTVSCGIAHFPQDGKESEGLIQKALTALQRAKEMGRNTIFLYGD